MSPKSASALLSTATLSRPMMQSRVACTRPAWLVVSRMRLSRPKSTILPRGFATDGYSSSKPLESGEPKSGGDTSLGASQTAKSSKNEEDLGAMSQRLQDLAEESDLLNPRATIRRMQQAEKAELDKTEPKDDGDISSGLSEALKNELLEKLKAADFSSENAAAISYSKLPSHASKHTREIAMSAPWSGTESMHDAALRMLNDAHKPLRGKQEVQTSRSSMRQKPVGTPVVNNTLRAGSKTSTPRRLINAREAAGNYHLIKKPEDQMTAEEREEVKRMLRERFQPTARAVPATIEGLAALANERIEDAFARGVFKNLNNTGKPLEEDHHANSPFIDTTTYLLNRAIQRQEITLPWIDRQKTLLREAASFRSRLRATWKRHMLRMIASSGGGADEWLRKAEEYAEAERIVNPDPSIAAKEQEEVRENKWQMNGLPPQIGERISQRSPPASNPSTSPASSSAPQEAIAIAASPEAILRQRNIKLFRDPTWLVTESGYHKLAIQSLNDLVTRYNLECPTIAQKVYYNLDRELKACYRQVSLEVVTEFRERATNPDFGKYLAGDDLDGSHSARRNQNNDAEGDFLKSLAGGPGDDLPVYEERKEKAYGFKQFLRDMFSTGVKQ